MALRVLCLVQLDDRDDTALTGTRFRTSRGFIRSQVPGLIVPKFHAIFDMGLSVSESSAGRSRTSHTLWLGYGSTISAAH